MKHRIFCCSAAAVILATACANQPTETRSTGTPPRSLAKGRTDTNSRANLVWADSVVINGIGVPAGIRGDGRLKDGSTAMGTPSNEYQGSLCGVVATLYTGTGESADLDYTPDAAYTSAMQAACHGGPRLYRLYLSADSAQLNDSALTAGPHSVARALATLSPGASVTQWEGFGIQQPNCPNLMFNDAFPPSRNLRYTRVADVVVGGRTVRQWRIESQGTHVAACVANGNKPGTYVPTGATYFVPFSLTVTEVPYPFPSFP